MFNYNVATPQNYGAKADGVTDDTLALQTAIDQHKHIHLPEGIYRINPEIGLILRTGTYLSGDGVEASVLFALPGEGSILKRKNPSSRGDYVQSIICEKFAVVLNHSNSLKKQIAFDFRHITRSTISKCYAGNYPRSNCKPRPATQPEAIRGYGVVLGTMSSGLPNYSGGEVNTIESVAVWGVEKCIVIDDAILSPNSAAHNTTVTGCDLQIAEVGISQESKYGSSCVFTNNVIQSVQRGNGSVAVTNAICIEGFNNLVDGGYIEITKACLNVLLLGKQSKANQIRLPRMSGSLNGVTDQGANNAVVLYGKHG